MGGVAALQGHRNDAASRIQLWPIKLRGVRQLFFAIRKAQIRQVRAPREFPRQIEIAQLRARAGWPAFFRCEVEYRTRQGRARVETLGGLRRQKMGYGNRLVGRYAGGQCCGVR